ncbi:MAG TPA: biotin carboxylase N-terminal domain-containing protein, partial [Candidatus Kryptonia bacterium]|nr:biotin carboxylase N-terminal domain-containing protein [Candidatus Kryptonia bacterium]
MKKLLVANRGEIAVRIMHAAAELGIRTVAVFSEDDGRSLHVRRADEAQPLRGVGVAAYLDIDQIVGVAKERGCDAIHPGYGFLSENAAFARRCRDERITFVGPRAETLAVFGDKTQARALAERCKVPVLKGTSAAVTLEQTKQFLASLGDSGTIVIKAVAGGGGRGMRVVRAIEEVDDAYARCRSEAQQAFGNGDVYVEQLMPRARHVEVQVIGDGSGAVTHLGERECSIQRRHQKLIEIAPCPSLSPDLRARIASDALRMAEAVRFHNAGTFEFLVDADAMSSRSISKKESGEASPYAFIEANARLQVEHTVTEEVFGVDLVRIQLQLATGRSLAEIGLAPADVRVARGFAVQARINTETMGADGRARPASGTLVEFELPSGHGVRTDTCGYVGYQTSPNFDSLLAKLIGHSTSSRFADAVARTARALGELRIEGVRTNLSFLKRVLEHPDFVANRIDTSFIDEHLAELITPDDDMAAGPLPREQRREAGRGREESAFAGAKIDAMDPLAVLHYGKIESSFGSPIEQNSGEGDIRAYDTTGLEDTVAVHAPMQGTIVSLEVREGDTVHQGQAILIVNAMKMEHVIQAPAGGVVRRLTIVEGDTVPEGHPLVFIEARAIDSSVDAGGARIDLDHVRPDLAEVQQRHAITLDAARPDAVARRRKTGQRTARENIADLCDPGTFTEYGALQVAAQRQRRSLEDLIERTPADGLVAGIGRVNGNLFDEAKTQCVVLSYDYTVLAGTQGFQNHRKKDRMFELAERLRIPVVFFTEGGGGRPGDTDAPGVAGLDCMAFHLFGKLSGLVPLIGINSGRCFAGNAAILGCCDVVIATANSNIGMGGPAMIEGGGLGVFRPEEVGPMSVQAFNGVVDVAVKDEAEAVRVAKQ